MFHNIPDAVLKRMRYLEDANKNEKTEKVDVKPHHLRLRQIPPETGKFISLVALNSPKGQWIEIGTSAGYSTLWLTLACKSIASKITTFELEPQKIELAKETFLQSNVEQYVELVPGNVFNHLSHYTGISFCFLDTEKELYTDCYETVIPNMVSGGILLADNVISHKAVLGSMINHALQDERVDSVVVPIGEGILMCRKL
ncbi:MAG: class I SAM-dependent methyltransferase [Gammaproteobacteria bacterium]|nr:class I SAM-dependent methyltransferase [Gammaproteobacteria bacterium]